VSAPLRIGIVGFDHPHVLRFAPMLAARPDVRLAWISADGPNRESGRAMAASLGVEFRDEPGPGVDAAYVATTPGRHLAVVEELAARGVHLLVDKPIALTPEDGRAIERIAREAGIRLMVPFNPRGQLGPRAVKERIERGELGDIRLVHAVKVGKVPLSIPGLDPAWLIDPAQAGFGGFGDIGIHALDALRWLIGREPVSVYARIHNGNRPELPVDSIGTAVISWEGGAISSLTAGWANPDGYPISLDARFEVVGSLGAARVDHPYQEIRLADGVRSERLAVARTDAAWVLDSFVGAVVRDVEPPITADDGVRALELLLACYRSSQLGEEVAITP
jgi:UDP-N-acetylglucosamine 3-dehydrogenase